MGSIQKVTPKHDNKMAVDVLQQAWKTVQFGILKILSK